MSRDPAVSPTLRLRKSPASSLRKRKILEGAVRLFRERGYHGTSIRDIGAEAGVTSAALYRHFVNKDAVLETALWEFARLVAEASRNAVEQERQSPGESLRALVHNFAAAGLEERDFLAAYLFEARNLRPEVFTEMQRSEREYRDQWMHYLRMARPELSETGARAMVRAGLLMVAHGCTEDPELDAGRLADLLTNMATTAMLGGPE